MQEIWKDIPQYEGLYKCSNLGRILSIGNNKTKKDKILKFGVNNYQFVNLSKNKIVSRYYVHELVAITFLNYIKNGRSIVINHIDGNKINNILENLEIVSNRYNVSDGYLRKNKTSKYTGVSWDKNKNKWVVSAWNSEFKKKIFLGYFKCELKAAYVYNMYIKS